jgi:pimeloyl-ACP methyl ester carboxylesterase
MTESTAVRHVFVDAGGLRLHQLDYGGRGDPIVMLHGVTGHAAVWHHVARQLSGTGRVIALDLRGFGDSQWSPTAAYRTVDHAADVVAVLAALELRNVTLVGSSWGALVALAVAHGGAGAVARLALVDIEPSFESGETDIAARSRSFASHADAVAHERAANPHAPHDLLELVAALGTRPAPDGRLIPKHDPYFFERWPFRGDDWWHALASIPVPTLVVQAGASFVRRDVTIRMAELIPAARHVDIADSTHVVPIDAPAPLAAAIGAFIG